MTESWPLPDNTVHSRFLDYAAERKKKQGGLYLNRISEKYCFFFFLLSTARRGGIKKIKLKIDNYKTHIFSYKTHGPYDTTAF